MPPPVTPPADVAAAVGAWSAELERALLDRSAWAHLGALTIVSHRGTSTLGGFIDRRLVAVPAGKDPVETLLAWRRSTEGRVVDRLVVQASSFLVQRLGPASRTTTMGEAWLDGFEGTGNIVALGAAGDLMALVRASRGHPNDKRLKSCAADGVGSGRVALVTGETPPCTLVAMISGTVAPDGVHVISVIDVRTRGRGRLDRVDVVVSKT